MSMSSTLCFSVAETLRCAGLTRQESVQLLIPALIQGAIGLPLLYFKRRNGKCVLQQALSSLCFKPLT